MNSSNNVGGLFAWFRPAPPKPRLPPQEVARLYPVNRWRVFEAAFLAYAGYYLVRNNLGPVAKELGAAFHYDKSTLGDIFQYSALSYGLGKFVMGYFADRSDARKYVATGLFLSGVLNFLFAGATTYWAHIGLWTLNGFIQGMGYGPCTRGLSHWFSVRERGKVFGAWNISHNLGGGIAGVLAARCAEHWGWSSAFYVPGAIAILGSFYLFWRMRDTPQSLGLPPVEEYRNDFPSPEHTVHERDLTAREMFFQYILPNKMLWILAFANVFVYIARYAMLDWGPTYLKEAKGASLNEGGNSTLIIEFAGAAGMLCMGWISDRIGGLRSRVTIACMIPLVIAFAAIPFVPKGWLSVDMLLFGIIGFFVYTPVLFSGVISLDLTNKKAVGTASGFVGMFGYIGRALEGKWLGWTAQHYGWDAGVWAVVACTIVGMLLLACLWNVRPKT